MFNYFHYIKCYFELYFTFKYNNVHKLMLRHLFFHEIQKRIKGGAQKQENIYYKKNKKISALFFLEYYLSGAIYLLR